MFTKQILNPTIRLIKETNSVCNENFNFNFKNNQKYKSVLKERNFLRQSLHKIK